ncbi:MAG: type II secretion system protein [Desulfobacterales bacterium]|nr:MAG: type II secretion system protein [Desulfobacterales bacterium]
MLLKSQYLKASMPFFLIFRRNSGFTLIELIVVISLFSIMLFFAIPRFQGSVFQDNTKQVSRWIIFKVQTLKEKAVRDQLRYVLHINLDTNTLWTTHDAMSEEDRQAAQANGFRLPTDVNLLDVEYPDENKVLGGQADIHFYKKGYSDNAIIHVENSHNEQHSFIIEPFLTRVRMVQEYIELND